MALKDQIFQLVEPLVIKAGLVLEEVQVQTPGKNRFVTVIVDSETGLNLDQVTDASRLIGEAMDGAAFMGETPYTLEVTSDRKSTRLNSSHVSESRMPSSA